MSRLSTFKYRTMPQILSSASNKLLYSLSKEIDNIEVTDKVLKKVFTMNKVSGKENDADYVEKQHLQFKKKIMRKKLENDTEYKQLCEFIDNPRFEDAMTGNKAFLRYIVNHKYIIYHPRYDEINDDWRWRRETSVSLFPKVPARKPARFSRVVIAPEPSHRGRLLRVPLRSIVGPVTESEVEIVAHQF